MSKKLIIPKQQFADMSIYSPEYQIRLRLISEDRNSFSAWSPVYSVNPEVEFVPDGTDVAIEKHSEYTNFLWNAVKVTKTVDGVQTLSIDLPHYDVWIRWSNSSYGDIDAGTWTYMGRMPSTSASLLVPSGMNHVSVEVYRPGRPVERSNDNGFLMYATYDFSPV
jgi:hypothetical protein